MSKANCADNARVDLASVIATKSDIDVFKQFGFTVSSDEAEADKNHLKKCFFKAALRPVTTPPAHPSPFTSFFINSRMLIWGAPTPLEERGGRRTPSASSRGSVASDVIYADVRVHIPMPHNNDAGCTQTNVRTQTPVKHLNG